MVERAEAAGGRELMLLARVFHENIDSYLCRIEFHEAFWS